MSNPNFKGRKKGSTKKTSLISDPLLGDHKIIFSEDSFNLIYIDPNTKKEKVLGYYTQLGSALRRVAKDQTMGKQSVYSLREYLNELETTLTNLKTLTNYV